MLFLGVVLIVVLGIHYIAKGGFKATDERDNRVPSEPLLNLSKDGEFSVEVEREFQKIVEGIKKEQN